MHYDQLDACLFQFSRRCKVQMIYFYTSWNVIAVPTKNILFYTPYYDVCFYDITRQRFVLFCITNDFVCLNNKLDK